MPRVQDVVHAQGYQLQVVQKPSDIDATGEYKRRKVPLTEPLDGPDGQLVRHLSKSRPALLIIDLNSTSIPWLRWIQVIKTSAATRRIPIIAFGPHVQKKRLKAAKHVGADATVTLGEFQNKLPELIEQWSRPSVAHELRSACSGEVSALAFKGIQNHNAMQFFEAHEDLELAWMEASEHEGYLYRALLQTTVAYLHIERGNLRGAAKMLLRVRQWLDPLPDECMGIDIQHLRSTVARLRGFMDGASSGAELPELVELFKPFVFTADQS